MPDFKVLRGSAVISSGQASLTLTDGVDYTLESGIAGDAWFFAIANNHFTGMGRTSAGGNQNADDVTVSFTYSGNNVTLTRSGTANNCRVDWQIVQYIGASGGANEIKVRAKGELSTTAASVSVALPGSVVNSSKVVPWVAGQRTNHTGRNNWNRGLFTSEVSGGDAVFDRSATGNTGWVSYALVEFTGSAWSVGYEEFAATSTNDAVAITAVADASKTFLHATYRYAFDGGMGLDDASNRVHLEDESTIRATSTTSLVLSEKIHSVWLIENDGMSVDRYIGTMAGSGEEEVADIAITSVSDTEQVITTLSNDSTGVGVAFPRGYINHLLLNSTTLRLRQSDNGQTSRYAFEVVTLPETSGPPDLNGTGLAQESGSDVASGSGSVAYPNLSASGAPQETGSDTVTGSGVVAFPDLTAFGSPVEVGSDAASGAGSVAFPEISGSGAVQEADNDNAVGSGFVTAPLITGSGAVVEREDIAAGRGNIVFIRYRGGRSRSTAAIKRIAVGGR